MNLIMTSRRDLTGMMVNGFGESSPDPNVSGIFRCVSGTTQKKSEKCHKRMVVR